MSKEKTISKEISFSGKALQTGREVKVVCKPSEAGSGIIFRRVDLPAEDDLSLKEGILSFQKKRRSTISKGKAEVQTVEHLLAALWALEIDNVLIEVNREELPAMDGSALGFIEKLRTAGVKEQDKEREYVVISEEEVVENEGSILKALPYDGFSVSFLIDYSVQSIGKEVFEFNGDKTSFIKEIAPARTFCLKKEALLLRLLGLGRGATYENTLIMGKKGPAKTTLRFPNEPVRHKILDLVGDLNLLGKPIKGKFVAEKSGHLLNGRMVKKIYEKYIK